MRVLKFITIFLVVIIFSYSIGWYITLRETCQEINEKYAGKDHDISAIGGNDKYILRFKEATPAGFPFKFAINLKGWAEEGKSSITECSSPITIGYDLFKESLFVSYTGNLLARYKPLQSGYGTKITTELYSLSTKIPLTLELIKILKSGRDSFKIINYVKNFKLNSGKVTLIDLVDQSVLYDQDFEIIHFSFVPKKYYENIDDFLKNIPQQLDLDYSAQINNTSFIRRPSPVNLMFGISWPFILSGNAKIYLKTGSSTLNDIAKDLEIGVTQSSTSSSIHAIDATLLYKEKVTRTDMDITLKTNAKLLLKQGFIDQLFMMFKYFDTMIPAQPNLLFLKRYLADVINRQNEFNLTEFENREYDVNLDLKLLTSANKLRSKIQTFSIFSGRTGIHLNDDSDIMLSHSESKGNLLVNNYPKIIDIAVSNAHRFGKYKLFSDTSKELYLDVAKQFLKAISDHPESKSNDISFEYNIDSSNYLKSKVGSTIISKIPPLYYLALYKNAIGRIKPGDNIKEKVKELIPDIESHPKLFEQFFSKSLPELSNVQPDIVQQLLK